MRETTSPGNEWASKAFWIARRVKAKKDKAGCPFFMLWAPEELSGGVTGVVGSVGSVIHLIHGMHSMVPS